MTQFGQPNRLTQLIEEARRRAGASTPASMPNFPEVDRYFQGGQATLSEGFDAGSFGPGPEILPLQDPGLSQDEALANIRQRFKTQAPGAWAQMTPQEQQAAAQAALQAEMARPQDQRRGIASTPIEVDAQQAIQRVRAFQSRQYQYENPQDLARDLEVLRARNAQVEGGLSDVRAQQIADTGRVGDIPFSPGAALMAAADTGSAGLGAGIRGAVQPETAGLEPRVAAQAPGSTILGAVAGGGPLIGGAAHKGAQVGAAAIRTRALGVGGKLQRAGGAAAGGFVAGELAQAPIAYNQARSLGASHEDALAEAHKASAAYVIIAQKLATGEDLNDEDAMNLAFLIPELIGELPTVAQPTRQAAAQIRERLQANSALRQQAIERLEVESNVEALEALAPDRTPSPMADEPAQPSLELDDPVRSHLDAEPGLPPSSLEVSPRLEPEILAPPPRTQEPATPQFRDRVTQDEVVNLAAEGRGASQQELDLQRGLIDQLDHRGEDFVLVDVPTSRLKQVGSFSEDSTGRVQEYAGMPAETAPPVTAGRIAGAGDQLMVVDGKHRWAAAMVRGDQTVRAYVPEHVARELEAAPRQEAPDAEGQGIRQQVEQDEPIQGRDAGVRREAGVEPGRRGPREDVDPEDPRGPEARVIQEPGPEAVPPPPQKARKLVRKEEPRVEPPPRQSVAPEGEGAQPAAREYLLKANRAQLREIVDQAQLRMPKSGTNDQLRARVLKQYDADPELRSRIETVARQGSDRVDAGRRSQDRETPRAESGETDMEVLDQMVESAIEEADGEVGRIPFSDMSTAEIMRVAQRYRMGTATRLTADQQIINTHLQNRGINWRNLSDQDVVDQLTKELGEAEAGSPRSTSTDRGGEPPRPRPRRPQVKHGRKAGGKGVMASPDATQADLRTRRVAQTEDSAKSPHRIIADLNKKLGIGTPGIGKSRTLKTWAMGFIRVRPEAIRLRMADAMETHMHEVGHFLHKTIFQGGVTARANINRAGLNDLVFPARWRAELESLGKNLYSSRRPPAGYVAEGWAEWVRLAFTDPDAAKAAAPVVHREAMSSLAKEAPKVFEALDTFRKQYQLWDSESPQVKAAGYIREHPVRNGGLAEAYYRMRVLLFDRMESMIRLKKDVGQDNLPADMDPHIVAKRAFGRASGDFKRALEYGRFDPVSAKVVGKSLAQILEPARNVMSELDTYLAVRRAIEKRSQGHKGVFSRLTDQDLKTAQSNFEERFPEFKEIAKEFQEFNRWLIEDYAVQHGLLNGDQAKRIVKKNMDYVTFAKVVFQDDVAASGRVGKRFVDTGSGVKRFADFAGEQIDPPIEAFVAHMQGIMNRAQMNRVGQAVTSLFYEAEGMGRWIDKVDQPLGADVVPGDVAAKQLTKRLEEAGIDASDLDQATMDLLLGMMEDQDFKRFRPVVRIDKQSRVFTVYRDGKPEFWQAKNKDLAEFLEGMNNPAAIEGLVTLLSMPKNVLRAGATGLNPEFFIPNFVRDFVSSIVFSSVGPKGFTDTRTVNLERAKAVWKALTTGRIEDAYLASGADMAGLFGEYYDPRTARLNLDRMFERPGSIVEAAGKSISPRAYDRHLRDMLSGDFRLTLSGASKMVAQPFMSFFDTVRVINERFEMANRLAEFEASLAESALRSLKDSGIERPTARQVTEWKAQRKKEGWVRADLERAGQAAADITLDFQAGGTTARYLNQFIPFFNAMFLGTDKLAREFKNRPARTAGRVISFVVIPTIAEHILNRNEEEYWDIPLEIRDRYWFLPMGDRDDDGVREYVRLPKPYGLGSFAVLTSRMLAAVDGIDPTTGNRGDPEVLKGLQDPNPLRNALLKDFRPAYNVPLVTTAFELMANYSIFYDNAIVWRGEQKGIKSERGAERSSELAVMMGELMDVEPPKIDYTIRSIFAGLGDNINRYALDPTLRAIRDTDRPRSTRNRLDQPEDYLILKRFIVEEPTTFSETMRRFYGNLTELEDINRSFKDREKTDSQKAREYYERHAAEIRAYELMAPSKARIDELMKQLKATYREQDLDGQEFRDKTRGLIDRIHEEARRGMSLVDEHAARGLDR